MAEVTLASMEETGESFPVEGAAVGAAQDPSLYAAPDVYPTDRHPAPAYEQQPEAKKPKREPIWHQFTLPDTKEGIASKKRVCKEPACGCIIHHGCAALRARPMPSPKFLLLWALPTPPAPRAADAKPTHSPRPQAEPVGGAHTRRHPRRQEDGEEVRVAGHRGNHGG